LATHRLQKQAQSTNLRSSAPATFPVMALKERPMSEFDFEKRRQERLQGKQRETGSSKNDAAALAAAAQKLSESISRYYGARFRDHFDQSMKGPTITLTKKGGGTTLTVEVLGKEKFKLSGGSGPGGLGADVGQSMGEVGQEDMMDTVDEWFDIGRG
jgi:hypothetical protein